jgi:hypothetical protein
MIAFRPLMHQLPIVGAIQARFKSLFVKPVRLGAVSRPMVATLRCVQWSTVCLSWTQVSFTEAPDFDFDITMGTAGAKVLDALPMVKVGLSHHAGSSERHQLIGNVMPPDRSWCWRAERCTTVLDAHPYVHDGSTTTN